VAAADNESLIRRYVDELNQRNLDILDELVAEEVDFEDRVVTHAEYRAMIVGRIAAMPDYHVTIDHAGADEITASIRWTYRGTLAANAAPIEGHAATAYTITDGRITAVRDVAVRGG